MTRIKKRLAVDAALTALVVIAMLHQFTGQTAHEIAGAAFFVGLLAHVIWGRKLASGIAKRAGGSSGASSARGLLAVMIVLSAICIAMLLSALVISRALAQAGSHLSDLNVGHVWSRIHIVCSYLLCMTALIHFAIHWTKIVGALRGNYSEIVFERAPRIVWVAAIAGCVALCVLCVTSLAAYNERQAYIDDILAQQQQASESSDEEEDEGSNASGYTRTSDSDLGIVSVGDEDNISSDEQDESDTELGRASDGGDASKSAVYPPGHPEVPAELDGKCAACHS